MEALKQSAEPLAQLKDIHLPEQIHNYPLAYGWWLLLACLAITILFVIIKWQKRRQLCQAQKLALTQLKNTENNDEIVTILKWAAFQYFPRSEIASLHGHQLQHFFQQKLATQHQEKFQRLSGQQLVNKYQAKANNSADEDLKQAARLWLSQALPPKKLNHKNVVHENIEPQGVVS